MYILYINQLSFFKTEAAVFVVAPTINCVACPLTMLSRFVAADFPPTAKITPTTIRISVKGIAKYGE